jgi:glucokinase
MSIIGLDIGGTKMTGGIIHHNHLKKSISRLTPAQGRPAEVIAQIISLLDSLVDQETQAIGLGVPGLVDTGQGMIFEAVNIPSWKKLALKKILEKKYGLPVFINNDANCFAAGEKQFGQGQKYHNLVGVTLGTGLGAGVIIDDRLYSGHTGGAGEFGQIGYQDGVVEQYASGQFFQKKHHLSGEALFEQALGGNKKSREIFEEFGYHLGKALSIIVYAVDPEIIILGGSVSTAFKFFEKSMKKSLKESSYKRSYSQLKISVSRHPHSALLGAAWLCGLTQAS